MPKVSALTAVYNTANTSDHGWREADVTIDQLITMLISSNCHHVNVSAPVFGLVETPIDRVVGKLRDDFFVRQLARMQERHGSAPVASVSLHAAHVLKRRTYDPQTGTRDFSDNKRPEKLGVSIHWIGVRVDEYIYLAS